MAATATAETVKPRRITRLPLKEWEYLKLKVWSENFIPNVTEVTFRMSIQQALQSSFGLAGASIVIDVLDWDDKTNIGFIKVSQKELVTVWTALTLHQFRVSGHACSIEVLGASASLISLADDSRSLN
ncbi:hypothetical protein BDB00DRAFT_379827 [Zychaea mexicana]|uniref:uncharacterized protein n=1 Tax=Zychaea mexicana TaxID=64656 RepID=UPI0022FE01A4|nr:uncharacterized protein BDB00DRAFT_379827 [Zychaea mexicana]KAI9493217.1 hypothetical protein BDB00DRAFT_379827 [Zychaea mexicana]